MERGDGCLELADYSVPFFLNKANVALSFDQLTPVELGPFFKRLASIPLLLVLSRGNFSGSLLFVAACEEGQLLLCLAKMIVH